MAARVSDWYFTNGNTPEGMRKQVEDIRDKAAADGRTVKIGVNAFAIARDTEAEAKAVLDEIIAKANPEAVHGFAHEVKNAGKASPEGEGNWAKSSFEDLVQYNDGFRSNLIGTPEQIAERIIAHQGCRRRPRAARLPALPGGGRVLRPRVIPLVRELEAARPRAGRRGGVAGSRPVRGARAGRTAFGRRVWTGAFLRAEALYPAFQRDLRPDAAAGRRRARHGTGAARHRAELRWRARR